MRQGWRLLLVVASQLASTHAFAPAAACAGRRASAHHFSSVIRPVTRTSVIKADLPNIDGTGFFRYYFLASVQHATLLVTRARPHVRRNEMEYPTTMDVKVIGDNEGPFGAP